MNVMTTLGIEIYNPMREPLDIGKMGFQRQLGGLKIVSLAGSSAQEDVSQQSSNHCQTYSTMEDSGNINNRGFTSSSHHQPTSMPLYRMTSGSERDSSTWTNTGIANNLPRNVGTSALPHTSDQIQDNNPITTTAVNYPTIQRSQSMGDNSTHSDNGKDFIIIEEKRKQPNGDGYTIHKYTRGKLLGKGGFAKVYQCTAMDTGKIYAVKVVPKANLVKARARQKLQAEIKIHRNLKHEHICQYKHYFEDRNNCYILLELCHNQSLNEMIKRRKRLTEPEAAYFLSHLLSATRYMHGENVIHRDLKLGNLFLDKDMVIKVGDLGLATKLEDKDEKRKTICGTPNYIAPEIIQGDKSKRGHSFEVDIWSMGVILYTVLIGKPPYEAKDVKATYQRISNNEYSFPRHIEVSDRAKSLIKSMLQSNPADRPSLDQIEYHSFLAKNETPSFLPSSVMSTAPIWRLNDLGNLVCTDDSTVPTSQKFSSVSSRQPFMSRDPNLAKASSAVTSSRKIEKNTYDINLERIGKAALASMTAANNTNLRSNPSGTSTNSFKVYDESKGGYSSRQNLSKSPLLSKPTNSPMLTAAALEAQNLKIPSLAISPPASITESSTKAANSHLSSYLPSLTDDILLARTKGLSIKGSSIPSNKSSASSALMNVTSSAFSHIENDIDILKKMADHVDEVLEPADLRKVVNNYNSLRPFPARQGPSKWVTRYVDYTSKYGLGFLLNDGSSGVYFNDSTKTALEAHGTTFQYIERKKTEEEGTPKKGETVLETFSLDEYPDSLKKKVTLLKHFRNYLVEQQSKADFDSDNPIVSQAELFGDSELVYVKKWVRTKHAILFFLSNRTVQVIFYDQTEVLLTPDVSYLTYVDKNRVRSTYNFTRDLLVSYAEIEKRLKYTKEIMVQLLTGHRS